jgi:hypothetical protein
VFIAKKKPSLQSAGCAARSMGHLWGHLAASLPKGKNVENNVTKESSIEGENRQSEGHM